jgi:ankyrin repeat protein
VIKQIRLDEALTIAVRDGNDRATDNALREGANPFSITVIDERRAPIWKTVIELLRHGNDAKGERALATAFRYQSLNVARTLLRRGARASDLSVDNHGMTELMYSARGGDTDLVIMLLAAGAHKGIRDDFGGTAISYAKEGGHADTVSVLLKDGAR